jgi:hypothetical protein
VAAGRPEHGVDDKIHWPAGGIEQPPRQPVDVVVLVESGDAVCAEQLGPVQCRCGP